MGEGRTKMFGVRGVMVGHAQDLHAVDDDFFVLQDANAGEAQRVKISRLAAEQFVVSDDKIRAEGSVQIFPWRSDFAGVDMGSIKEISGQENYIGLQ